jgi:hypothetical protein
LKKHLFYVKLSYGNEPEGVNMKNLIITTLTVFSFATAPVFAGEASMNMNNAFAYSKSTQSAGSAPVSGNSAGSAGSAGSSPGSFAGPNGAILLGLALIAVVIIAASSGGGGNSTYPGSM